MNYGKNTTGLSDKAFSAENYYLTRGLHTYEGSMIALGLDKDKVHPDLLADFERRGERNVYSIYLNMDHSHPASAVEAQVEDVLVGRAGMTYVPGPDWQGEPDGYRQTVGGTTLIFLSRLGAVKKIYRQIG